MFSFTLKKEKKQVNYGRFGNIFIRNIIIKILSKKYDTECLYGYCDSLGISFKNKVNNSKKYVKLDLDDKMIENLLYNHILIDRSINHNLKLSYCQEPSIIYKIIEHFNDIYCEDRIDYINSNPFSRRFDNNDDIFIHVRCGDISDHYVLPDYDYYEKVLNMLLPHKGKIFLSTDNPNYKICQKLMLNFDINLVNMNESDTIYFGSTCNNIILSSGSFSFLIGLFAFFSKKVYYSFLAGYLLSLKTFEKVAWHPYYFKQFSKIDENKYIIVR